MNLFWILFSKGKVAAGTGTVAGKNVIIQLDNTAEDPNVGSVVFSGWDKPIEIECVSLK